MSREPLASRLRPQTLDEVVGQEHLLAPGRLLRRLIETDQLQSLILFGPPGTGKTSLVRVIANSTQKPFVSLNAVSHGVKEIREAAEQGRWAGVILHIDEVHRLSKNQAEVLLPVVEGGTVTFIGTTTENPYLEVPPALRSRSTIFELKPLAPAAILQALERAVEKDAALAASGVSVPHELLVWLSEAVGGDLRAALTALEVAVMTSTTKELTQEWLAEALGSGLRSFSKGDEYDLLSALQKSIRGSDPDAAAFYLARLVDVRFDLETICRRLMVIASEDIGNAYPQAISITVACAQAAQMVGYPEARIHLAQAAAFLASLPKSNAAFAALEKALTVVDQGQAVPLHLRDAHYKGAAALGRGVTYKFPHDYPGNYVRQQYLPDELVGMRFYEPTDNGMERRLKEYLERLRRL